ncbi:MAG TPA: FtsX-like permease family protein [Kofleriaceae bacterium]|nr:FtsX-like permease family protein [Kofleriaceae bacterium]
MSWVTARYAMRSVSRNLRRTSLSIAGIAIGCALALFMESLNRGRDELIARLGADSGIGHLRVVPAGWDVEHDVRLRLADWHADLAAARSLPGVALATPRVRTQVLLAMGTRAVAVEMVGVDPEAEQRAFRFVRDVSAGRYLRPGETGEMVVGRAIAERLDVGVGDEILATAVGRGGHIESAMFRITGVIATGSEDIDAGICQVVLGDVPRLAAQPGAGEITIVLADWRATETARAALAARVAPGDQVRTWSELTPELTGHTEQDKATSRFVSAMILVIVVLGVASAQLAAVLDRRRELAVLAAIGVSARRMVAIMFGEAMILGVLGAAAGLAIGLPIVGYLSHSGLDFRSFLGASWTFEGVVFEPIIYPELGPWVVPYIAAVAIGATLVAFLYPAWVCARTDPAVALRAAP